jgi:hypothetical protein
MTKARLFAFESDLKDLKPPILKGSSYADAESKNKAPETAAQILFVSQRHQIPVRSEVLCLG